MATDAVRTLPYVTVQADLSEVIADVEQGTVAAEDFWVSCYRQGSKGVHGKVRVSAVEGNTSAPYELEARDGVTCARVDNATLLVSCPTLEIPPTKVVMPRQTMRKLHPAGVECMDVAGDLVATGGKNGALRVDPWRGPLRGGEASYGRGHVGDLTGLSFLPSGQVLLTASSDLSSRIFAASPPPDSFLLQNPRTFHAPHTRGVSAASAIGKGRFVITACRDGGLRVWEVKTGEVVAEGIWPGGSAVGVEAMAVCRLGAATEAEPAERAEEWPPAFVSSLSIVLALSSGVVHIVSLPSLTPWSPDRQPDRPPSAPSPLDSLDVSPDASRLAVGSRNGTVSIYALKPASLLLVSSWRRNGSGVNSIRFVGPDRLAIAGADGLPYVVRLGADGEVTVEEEWAGFDTDPATDVRFVDGRGFVAGSDGCVRIYH